MFVKTYNQNGEESGKIDLPSELFDVKLNTDLLHQVVVSQTANRRIVIAHTKNRGEVRGGGKKPWAQKGLGKARHGSIRSPIWRHGGVVFGPRKERIFKKKIPDKMRRKALFMVLSAKVKNNLLVVLDELKLEKPKTKLMTEILNRLPLKGKSSLITELPKEAKVEKRTKSFLIALPQLDKALILAVRNIPKAAVIQAKDLNALDLLSFKYLLMPKESIRVIKETFLK